MNDDPGTVYLIHFDMRYQHAGHYLGSTTDLPGRLEAHRAGRGARLMEVITDAGITWHVSRTWPGGRDLERALKNRHEAPRLCPDCSPHPAPVTRGKAAEQLTAAQTAPSTPRPRQPERPAPYDRGAEMGRRFLREQEAAGRSAGQIGATYDYITGPWRETDARPAATQAAMFRGYAEAVADRLAQLHQAEAAEKRTAREKGEEMMRDQFRNVPPLVTDRELEAG